MVLIIIGFNSNNDATAPASVPYGDCGSYQSQRRRRTDGRRIVCFRPLTGIVVLIGVLCSCNEPTAADVSVPLRGLWFLSVAVNLEHSSNLELFPSPYGDYGSYPLTTLEASGQSGRTFPSPYGDYGSYPGRTAELLPVYEWTVSVPLRGLWFLSSQTNFNRCSQSGGVSVPLRGLCFLSAEILNIETETKTNSFRPLTGIMFLIAKVFNIGTDCLFACVSVPLRGLCFLSREST